MTHELFLDLDAVEANVVRAETEDLLDRATVYRNGMEPEALNLIDAELRARGIGEADLAAHRERRARTVYGSDGLAVKCGKCARPAVARKWGWHRLWGLLPVFPRPLSYCEIHLPEAWRDRALPDEEGAGQGPPPRAADAPGSPSSIMRKSEDVRPTSSD